MGIDISDVRKKKYIRWTHLFLYLFMIFFNNMTLFSNSQEFEDIMMKNIVAGVSIAIFCVLFMVELFVKLDITNNKSAANLLMFYYIFRIVVVAAIYFMTPIISLTATVELITLLICVVEMIFFIAYDEFEKRLTYYGIFFAGFGVVSAILVLNRVYSKQIDIVDCCRSIAYILIVTCVVIGIGEILAGIWDAFIKQILAQNRAMEDLNEANDALVDKQTKINKVNELLGLQKIELQSANKKINRAHDEMSVQNEISSAIVASPTKEELLKHVTKILQIRLDLDAVIVILEEDNSLLAPGEKPKGRYTVMATSNGEEFEKNVRKSVEETNLEELLTMTQTYIQNTPTETISFFKYLTEEQELPSIIIIPIVQQEQRLGTLIIGRNKENAFSEGRSFYENISSQISIGISNAKLYEKMNDMAIRDGLTRIYNRRKLNEFISDYLGDAIKKKTPVSLALFDIDKFKLVNDTYGHQCGDEVIRYVASLLNIAAIENDGICGRYGGEEFVIAFENKSLEDTYEICKEVHEKIKSAPVVYEGQEILVKASAGVASFPSTCSNPSDLLNRADWAMYHSKKNGRDQITIDSDQISSEM